jgi:fatty acyl-CoA reductase
VADGDISKPKLGLSAEMQADIEKETTVILHCAATTRFTEPIKIALELNILGSKRVLELAKRCKNLRAHVHVSTAYVNCVRNSGTSEIREKIYPIRYQPQDIIDRLSAMTHEQAELETDKIIAPYPNTYSFSKAVGEHLLLQERGNVPICIVRPSIVGCSWQDPVPGWMDSMIGANGLLLALGVGALRAMRGIGTNVVDFIPVDTVAACILAAAWRTANQYAALAAAVSPTSSRRLPLPVYHCTSSVKNPVIWNTPRKIVEGYFDRHPPKKSLGMPWAQFFHNPVLHYIAHFFAHLVPAAIADAGRIASGKKARMIKATYRLHKVISSLAFFTSHQWFFSTDNVDAMIDEMTPEDLDLFKVDIAKLNWEIYFIIYSEGIKRFLLKEADSTDDVSPGLRMRMAGDDIGPGIGVPRSRM